jgi:uncharacterized membrane protein YgcG
MTKLLSPKFNAFSLVEVLAVLALTGVVMIAFGQMLVRLTTQISRNEISDYANGIMLQAMEIAKSPTNLVINDTPAPPANFQGSYALDFDSTPNRLKLVTGTISQISTCTAGSSYQIAVEVNLPVCVQIIVQPGTSTGGKQYFQITTVVVYTQNGQPTVLTLSGYRHANFVFASNMNPGPILPSVSSAPSASSSKTSSVQTNPGSSSTATLSPGGPIEGGGGNTFTTGTTPTENF